MGRLTTVSMRCAFVAAAAALPLLLPAGAQPPQPQGQVKSGFPAGMPAKDKKLIMEAAGYEVSPNGQSLLRYCGQRQAVAKPGVAMLDFNGDGKGEVVVLSQNDCPGSNMRVHTALIWFDAGRGVWQNILDADGQPKPGAGRVAGWLNLNIVDDGTVTPFAYYPEGQRYDRVSTLQYRRNLALAVRPDRTPPGTLPTAGWAKPWSVGNLTPGQLAQIFVAAGYKRGPKGWRGCQGTSEAMLAEENNVLGGAPIMDMNGDGNPEVIVRDESYECYGNSGGAFVILAPVPGGWKTVGTGQDTPAFFTTRSRAGWLDYYEGGPGFCHPRDRNDGKGYQNIGQYAESPGGCR